MGYEIIKQIWDLNEEEQEKARFIVSKAEKAHLKKAHGDPGDNQEESAFELFKLKFYIDVKRRIGIVDIYSNYGLFKITNNCTQVTACCVKKIEEKGGDAITK